MSWFAVLAVVACLACILAKWLYAHQKTMLEKLSAIEKMAYLKSRRGLTDAKQQHERLIQEQKKLEAKIDSVQQSIIKLRKQENSLTSRELEESAAQARQKEMLASTRKR